jgi:PAS domain-containing protein
VHFLLYRAYASYPITPIRRAILRQVIDGFYDGLLDPNVPTELARGMGDALAEKNMQIWLSDHEEQAFLEAMGWDGAIEDANPSLARMFGYELEEWRLRCGPRRERRRAAPRLARTDRFRAREGRPHRS